MSVPRVALSGEAFAAVAQVWQQQQAESENKRRDKRERAIEGMEGREQPAAADPTAALIKLMVFVDGEGLNKDGEQRGEERRGDTLR